MKRFTGFGTFFLFLLMMFAACRSKNAEGFVMDTPTKGTIHISIDESYRPVMEEQLSMYETSNPETKFIASYKTEAECFRDFFTDTLNRMILVTRGLNSQEEKYMKDSLTYYPRWNLLAADAIAIIVNRSSADTLFTADRLEKQLTGQINREQTIVFDGLNATSTYRFINDSILKGKPLDTSVVKAAKTTSEVIDYVATHSNAIGFVGISWIGNPEIPEQVELLKKVQIAYVQCSVCADSPYVKPLQESIQTRRYPLVRGLYYIVKENRHGLGSGLVDFLKYERGQLIFRRAYLGPIMNFDVRNVKINTSMPKK